MLNPNRDAKQPLKAFLIFMGGYFFAICFIVPIHEIGHALSMILLGVDGVRINFNPFMGNTKYNGTISDANFKVILLAGTLFNITIATFLLIVSFLGKLKNAILLRFVGFVAYFVEGTVALGTLTTDIIVSDWAGLMYFGFPSLIVLAVGILFVIVASVILFTIWSVLGMTKESSVLNIILVSIIFFIHNLFSFVLAIILLNTDSSDIGNFMINTFYINIIIFICLILIYKYMIPRLNESLFTKENVVTTKSVYISVVSGSIMFVLSIISSGVTWVLT